MHVTSQHDSTVLAVGESPTPCRAGNDTMQCCRHAQRLLDIEGYLRDVLAIARESVARCEQALALIADARLRAASATPFADVVWQAGAHPTRMQNCSDHANDPAQHLLPAGLRHRRLTARESEVLQRIAAGHSNREIAGELFLSTRTVERHIANIYLKIDVHSKADATAYAYYHGLIEHPST